MNRRDERDGEDRGHERGAPEDFVHGVLLPLGV